MESALREYRDCLSQGIFLIKVNSLRVYDFDQGARANALTYVSGHDFGSAAGFNLQFSQRWRLLSSNTKSSTSNDKHFGAVSAPSWPNDCVSGIWSFGLGYV